MEILSFYSETASSLSVTCTWFVHNNNEVFTRFITCTLWSFYEHKLLWCSEKEPVCNWLPKQTFVLSQRFSKVSTNIALSKYLREHVRSNFIHDGLGTVVEELVSICHVVDVHLVHRLHWRLRPKFERLRTRFQHNFLQANTRPLEKPKPNQFEQITTLIPSSFFNKKRQHFQKPHSTHASKRICLEYSWHNAPNV